MKKYLIYFIVGFAAMLTFHSCTEEYADIEITPEKEIQLKGGDTEAQFRTSLRDLVRFYDEANNQSNGALLDLLNNIADLESEDAKSELANSGLVDFKALESLVKDTDALQTLLEKEIGEEDVEAIVQQETANMQSSGNPFWGIGSDDDDCKPHPGYGAEPVGGIGGSTCYLVTLCKKFRFGIHWGGWKEVLVPVDCP